MEIGIKNVRRKLAR